MKIKMKIATLALAGSIMGTALVPSFSAFADSNESSQEFNIPQNNEESNSLFKENGLTDSQQKDFNEIKQSGQFSEQQLNSVLKDKMNQSNPMFAQKWKIALIKSAIKYGAKLIGKKLEGKTLTDAVNYLTGFEDNIQDGIQNTLVKYLHVNSNVAYWTAKTVVFVFF
jgi:hypothetical protein